MENELDQKKSQWQQRTSNKKEVRKLEMLELEIKEQNAELKSLGKLKESLQVYYSKDASKMSVDWTRRTVSFFPFCPFFFNFFSFPSPLPLYFIHCQHANQFRQKKIFPSCSLNSPFLLLLRSEVKLMHEWNRFFGTGEYDFKKQSPKEAKKRLVKLEEIQAKLSQSINRKVMKMFEK